MRPLTSLNPRFVGFLRPDSGEMLNFDCPACGPSHLCAIGFTNPLDGGEAALWPSQTWWTRTGETFETLTLVASTGAGPSVQYPCWHGWIEAGQVIDVSEATHHAVVPDDTGVSNTKIALSPMQVLALRRAGRIS